MDMNKIKLLRIEFEMRLDLASFVTTEEGRIEQIVYPIALQILKTLEDCNSPALKN